MKQVTIKDLIIFGLLMVVLVLAFLLLYIVPMKSQIAQNTGNIGQIVNVLNSAQRTPAQQPQPQREVKKDGK